MNDVNLSIAELFSTVMRRKFLFIACIGAVVSVILFVSGLVPKTYRANATILVGVQERMWPIEPPQSLAIRLSDAYKAKNSDSSANISELKTDFEHMAVTIQVTGTAAPAVQAHLDKIVGGVAKEHERLYVAATARIEAEIKQLRATQAQLEKEIEIHKNHTHRPAGNVADSLSAVISLQALSLAETLRARENALSSTLESMKRTFVMERDARPVLVGAATEVILLLALVLGATIGFIAILYAENRSRADG
jgi:hypothetical protein